MATVSQPNDPDAAESNTGGVRLADDVELARLIDLCTERLGYVIDYDPQAVQGRVAVRSADPISDAALWRLTNQALAQRGLTTVVTDSADERGRFTVVRLENAERASAPVSTIGPAAPGYARLEFVLRRLPAEQAAESVQSLLSQPHGSITPVSNSQVLVISDLTPRVLAIRDLLNRLDAPGIAASVHRVDLRHLRAAPLLALVEQARAQLGTVAASDLRGGVLAAPDENAVLVLADEADLPAWQSLIAQLDERQEIRTLAYVPGPFGVAAAAALIEQAVDADLRDDRWRVVADEITQTLLVTATPLAHTAVRDLLERLGEAPAELRRPLRQFTIRNRSVEDIEAVLRRLIDGGLLETPAVSAVPNDSAPPPGVEPSLSTEGADAEASAATSASRPARPPRRPQTVTDEPHLSITSDPATNTLLAIGEPRILEQIGRLLPTLDVRQPQVMLEVLIVSLTDSDLLDLGVELERFIDGPGDTRLRLASLFGLSTAADGLRSVGDVAGFSGLVLNPGDFSIVVRALQSLNEGRSLSTPSLLVSNNQQAVLDSVIQEPFTSTNASDTVATTSFGGTQDAGTTLTVRPQIAEGDHLLLEYSVSLSAFVGESADPNVPPPRQQNSVSSSATIPDGFTIAVGGIELTDDSEAVSKVPGVGDIPLVGELFKNRSRTQARSQFFVFIRANILRSRGFEDLRFLSEEQLRAADLPQDWPAMDASWIR